jgi:tetratricopeptide (TPR) repeat protein
MKRITLFVFLLFAGINFSIAQTTTTTGINYQILEDRLAKSNKNLQDEKKAGLLKTWVDRARVLEDIADVHLQYLRNGIKSSEIKLYFKEPKEIKSYSDGREEYIYDRITFTFEGGTLKYWNDTNPILPNAIDEAFGAYQKVKELDVENKNEKKIIDGYKNLRTMHNKNALNYYYQKDYANSFKAFDQFCKLGDIKGVSEKIDTIFIYYTGVTAQLAKMYDEAIFYFNKTKALGYKEPLLFTALKACYVAKGDTAKSIEALQEGLQAFPSSVDILIELINYYLTVGESTKALDYLQEAKKQDPSNKSYYFAEGTLHDKLGHMDKAVEAYTKAFVIDSTYFDAYYNLGVLYFNSGVKLTEIANNEMDNKKYAEKKKIADDEFRKALPFMEKAYKIVNETALTSNQEENNSILANKKAALENLKTLYYRLKMNDQFERINQLLKEL